MKMNLSSSKTISRRPSLQSSDPLNQNHSNQRSQISNKSFWGLNPNLQLDLRQSVDIPNQGNHCQNYKPHPPPSYQNQSSQNINVAFSHQNITGPNK